MGQKDSLSQKFVAGCGNTFVAALQHTSHGTYSAKFEIEREIGGTTDFG
jgi:hypothetical protein